MKRGSDNFSLLAWGLKGLKVSLTFLIIILFILLVFLIMQNNSFQSIIPIIFQIPNTELDFLAVLAGVIIFIALPFVIGVRIGMAMEKKY